METVDFLPQIESAISSCRSELIELATAIYNKPELGNAEFFAAEIQSEFLKKHNFEVTTNFGNQPTAFCGRFGEGKPVVAIFSEFDALPTGHACGHHLITLSALSAAVAVKDILAQNNLTGSVLLVGSPAEEAHGGKVELLRAGVLDEIDFALITHPFHQTNVDPGNLAVSRYDVVYKGRAAHASVAPEDGINALDAQNLLFTGIGLWRQQLPTTSRVHGVITAGGDMPNIIPDYTKSFFYLRSPDNLIHEQMDERFVQMAKGAAMMTGCELELEMYPNSYTANKSVKLLDELLRESAKVVGFELSEISQKISTDFANVTLHCPGANLLFDVIGDGSNVPLHSQEFLSRSINDFALEKALQAGEAIALSTLELMLNDKRAAEIKSSFAN